MLTTYVKIARPTALLLRSRPSVPLFCTRPSAISVNLMRTNTTNSAEKKTEAAAEGSTSTEPAPNAAEIEKLNVAVTELTEKSKSLEDKYKRALADGENMRLRLTKQIEDAKIFGIQSFCKDLLPVADTLAIATESVPKEEVTDSNPHLKNLYDGLTMTKASLDQVFKRHGLEVINPINEKFNPNLHEALFQQPVENAEPDTVVVVSKVGYKLHERCIRPALVGVSVAK